MGDFMSSSRILTSAFALVTVLGATVAVALPALAAPARTAPATVKIASGTGSYSTWGKAQKAAKFGLRKPIHTQGLKRTGKIIVDQCIVTGHLKDRVVDASWGNLVKKAFTLEQDNASIPCGNGEEGASLGHFKVQGVTAHMYGYCGTGTPYSCGSTNIALWLMWKKGKNYYIAASHDQTRANLLLFARTLRKV
jgi:hypothetical protein